MRTALLIAILALTLAARVPWMLRGPSADERAHAGAARQFALRHERTPPPLLRDTPAASHLGSPILWSLRAPAPEFDAEGPSDQIGWLALRDTALPTGDFVAPGVVIALMRLPFLLLHLVGVYVLFLLGERFYGKAAGAVAGGIAGTAAAACVTGATATPAALALPATAVLLAALDDFARAVAYDGAAPPWLLRKRTLALGAACGLALASSFALLPIVAAGVLWLGGRRGAILRRGESPQPPAFSRRVVGAVVALGIVWAAYVGDVAPYPAADMTLPAPLWWAGAVEAVRDAVAIPWADRDAALRTLVGPTLGACLVVGLVGWPFLRRDVADTPSLLVTLGPAALATAALVAPRHAPVALAAALPPFALLAGAWLVRLARHARVVAAAVAAVLLVGLAAGWHDATAWREPATVDARDLSEPLRPDEDWLLERWIASRSPRRVITLLGREPLLRATASSRIEEPPADAARVKALLAEIDGGADAALVVGDWVRHGTALPALDERLPDARFLRLSVYCRR